MRIFSLLIFFAICGSCLASPSSSEERTLPSVVEGVSSPVLSLNGIWDVKLSEKDKWNKVEVPGELAMQGYAIEHDAPAVYRKSVVIPKDFRNQIIILRFDGVYSKARLWVNGHQINQHTGGFTRWENDITPYAKIGQKNEIKLEVIDPVGDISYASGYAHHPIGGILRDVNIYALPQSHLEDFYVETLLDDNYKNATLRINYNLTDDANISFVLTDDKGKEITLKNNSFSALKGNNQNGFFVSEPKLWDAEHPNLYNLEVNVESKDGNYSFSKHVGFRKIEIVGDRMMVNGRQVKLRGACRHDIHPTLGRVATKEIDSLDAKLFKQANMNFVRTSHYPPTERFLEYCDKEGIYVECETAICFVDTHRQRNYAPGNSQNNPEAEEVYLGQLKEMVSTSRSHPSVLFWSIGNESTYGENFQKSYDWLKAADTTRPVIFSYPGLVEKGKQVYDILSMHYPGCDGTMEQYQKRTTGFQGENIPAIFDEWAHVPCYTYSTLQDDPNIREFWGISLDKMWANLFDAPGGLGGAIWGYSDETFMLPHPKKGSEWWIKFARTSKPKDFSGSCVGYGEWGIVDVWRREKPEFWGTKKAYSPVRLMETQFDDFTPGEELSATIFNRFDHTNLNEVEGRITYEGKTSKFALPDVLPHEKGLLRLPANDWRTGETALVEFLDSKGCLIDAEMIQLGVANTECQKGKAAGEALQVIDDGNYVTIKGDGFQIPFNKNSGLMENATINGKVVVEKGPFLNLDLNVSHKTGPEVREKASNYIVKDEDWQKTSFSFKKDGGNVSVELSGSYQKVDLTVKFVVTPQGVLNIDYFANNAPNGWLRESGLKFYIPNDYETLKWNRKGYWTFYPENSFAGNQGDTPLYNPHKVEYGENPGQSWNDDTFNYYYFADAGAVCSNPLTNKAKGMKENCYNYNLIKDGVNFGVLSSGAQIGCRLNKMPNNRLILYVDNKWDYPEIAWGDYCKAIEVIPVHGNMKIQF